MLFADRTGDSHDEWDNLSSERQMSRFAHMKSLDLKY
jgi:hypothetical protein